MVSIHTHAHMEAVIAIMLFTKFTLATRCGSERANLRSDFGHFSLFAEFVLD